MKIICILILFTILINLNSAVYTSFQLSECAVGNNTYPLDICSTVCGYQVIVDYHEETDDYAFNVYDDNAECHGAIAAQKFFKCDGTPQTVYKTQTISCSVPTKILTYTSFNVSGTDCDVTTLESSSCSMYCDKYAKISPYNDYSTIAYQLVVSDQSDCSKPTQTIPFNCLSGNVTSSNTQDTQVVCVDTSSPSSSSDNNTSNTSTFNYNSVLYLVSFILLNILLLI